MRIGSDRPGSRSEGHGWTIGAYLSAAITVQVLLFFALIALASVGSQRRETIAVSAGGAAVVLLIGVLIRLRVTRSIRSLVAALDLVGEANGTFCAPSAGPRELTLLSRRVSDLVDAHQRSESAMRDAYDAELESNERLRDLNATKDAFLMALSHDLRTPLASVVGYAGLLQETGADLSEKERMECVDTIDAQARRLEKLLGDLLDLERMTRGTIEMHLAPVRFRDLVSRVLDTIPDGARVHVDVPRDMTVVADPALLERVVENLVTNAVKHTPRRSDIRLHAVDDHGDFLLIVDDDGEGISDDVKEKIFEPFEQGEAVRGRTGTGVGLALVAEFAKLHGGRAWVEDSASDGASFRVRLPSAMRQPAHSADNRSAMSVP